MIEERVTSLLVSSAVEGHICSHDPSFDLEPGKAEHFWYFLKKIPS